MIKVSESDIHLYIKRNDVRTFKLKYWRTQSNITLVPKEEVLKILALKTPCLLMLKALHELQMDASVEDLIQLLESYH